MLEFFSKEQQKTLCPIVLNFNEEKKKTKKVFRVNNAILMEEEILISFLQFSLPTPMTNLLYLEIIQPRSAASRMYLLLPEEC